MLVLLCFLILRLSVAPPLPDLTFSIASANITEGSTAFFHISPITLRPKPLPTGIPGLRSRMLLHFASKGKRHFAVYLPVSHSIPIQSEPLLRGIYQLDRYAFHFSDILNIASFSLFAKNVLPASITVHPRQVPDYHVDLTLCGGEVNPAGSLSQLGNELGDQRKYVPGDDPRRINWKLYGHTEELFLRTRDKEPPPQGRLYLYLDTAIDKALFKDADQALDLLARHACKLAKDLLSKGLEVVLLTADGVLTTLNEETLEGPFSSLLPLADAHSAFTSTLGIEHRSLYIALANTQGITSHAQGLFQQISSPVTALVVCESSSLPTTKRYLKSMILKPSSAHTESKGQQRRILAACQKTRDACLSQGASRAQIIP